MYSPLECPKRPPNLTSRRKKANRQTHKSAKSDEIPTTELLLTRGSEPNTHA